MRRRPLAALIAVLLLAVGGGSAFAAPPPAAEIASARSSRARAALKGTVNLNAADEATLELLPGIGPTKARRIVEFRRTHPFKRADDLTRVKGIGRKTLAKLRPFLSVAGPTTLAEEAAN